MISFIRFFSLSLLASTLLISPSMAQMSPNRTILETETVTTTPITINKKTDEVKPAIAHFVELINLARLDIMSKEPNLALAKIDEARKLAQFIRTNSNVEKNSKETKIRSGKVVFEDQQTTGPYYVPFESGPLKLKTIESTPSKRSHESNLAVSSAEVVYMRVDLSDDRADKILSDAENALKQSNPKQADEKLAGLIGDVVIIDKADPLHYDKARDNLDLALYFLQRENYTATRYALNHVAEALQAMNQDSRYHAQAVQKQYKNIQLISATVMQQNHEAAQKARTQILEAIDKLPEIKK